MRLLAPTPIFDNAYDVLAEEILRSGKAVDTGHWQALKDVPNTKTIELEDAGVLVNMAHTIESLQDQIRPNLPWAEDHFLERVGGEPLNPGEQYKNWPYYRGNVETHKPQGAFSHTYMERFWPRNANWFDGVEWPDGHHGIRYRYGDLADVVALLAREPTTRQAYLPVWFPEDTGAHHGERVPCTLGYHFLLRGGKLNVKYFIRSCDFLRHFRDDVYHACRLGQWMLGMLKHNQMPGPPDSLWDAVTPGTLTMFISSLHVFEGDLPKLRRDYGTGPV